jgi:hypothetical protein
MSRSKIALLAALVAAGAGYLIIQDVWRTQETRPERFEGFLQRCQKLTDNQGTSFSLSSGNRCELNGKVVLSEPR